MGLGFDLKTDWFKQKSPLVIALLISLLGCTKEPEKNIDYGPEVDPSIISGKLAKALGERNILAVSSGEFTRVDTTRIIKGRSAVDLIQSQDTIVLSKNEVGEQVQFRFVDQIVEYDLSGNQEHQKRLTESLECVNKETLAPENCRSDDSQGVLASNDIILQNQNQALIEETLTLTKPFQKSQATLKAMAEKVSFHNLSEEVEVRSPPLAVQNQKNCGTLPNCQMVVRKIKFDQVVWETKEKADKISVLVEISEDVPFLSRILKKCEQGSLPFPQKGEPESEAPRLLLTFCSEVKDFGILE